MPQMFTRAGCCGKTVRIWAKAGPVSGARLRPLVETMRTDWCGPRWRSGGAVGTQGNLSRAGAVAACQWRVQKAGGDV